ncbi:hypothetical protein NCCP1664_24710 [Zafaria cholistanensis]|uniref:Uncharacterized protein n=1 Tax=Zafaria cholistanensis TaxID=1682741 RepID=A0A5A7NTQ3_9MICC|nr:hypothetical protein [Zafaria cholistanensis]GER23976.1 hypothetical protein NCCP1664_24710 [Zafaria cholistanensis]
MEPPTGPQRTILRQIAEHAGDLASVLEAQFASCTTEPSEHCQECFEIDVAVDVPRLPANTECPLFFDVQEGTGALGVLLWHEDGRINGLEVNSVIHPHAALSDLIIIN